MRSTLFFLIYIFLYIFSCKLFAQPIISDGEMINGLQVYPDQIKKNHQRKSTEGISTLFYVMSFVTYIMWTLHGILQGDWVVILGQGLGIITTGIIVYQIILYRKK